MILTNTCTLALIACLLAIIIIVRVGQNHIFTVYTRYFWQGYHLKYGQTRYTVLANPNHNTRRHEYKTWHPLLI
jgi:hypothetical protein